MAAPLLSSPGKSSSLLGNLPSALYLQFSLNSQQDLVKLT